jgi:hypothetical protein
MREQLAIARKQMHEAHTHGEIAEARAHLDLCCDMLDALGWDDREPEVDVPVEGVTAALRGHLEVERRLAATHDTGQRERAEFMVLAIRAMLELIESDR